MECVQRKFAELCTIEEYIAANRLEWKTSFQRLLPRAASPKQMLHYPFETPICEVLESEAPHLLQPSGAIQATAALPAEAAPTPKTAPPLCDGADCEVNVLLHVIRTVQVLGVSDLTVSADVPLMESGIDSLDFAAAWSPHTNGTTIDADTEVRCCLAFRSCRSRRNLHPNPFQIYRNPQ